MSDPSHVEGLPLATEEKERGKPLKEWPYDTGHPGEGWRATQHLRKAIPAPSSIHRQNSPLQYPTDKFCRIIMLTKTRHMQTVGTSEVALFAADGVTHDNQALEGIPASKEEQQRGKPFKELDRSLMTMVTPRSYTCAPNFFWSQRACPRCEAAVR